jgi:hypothetical protein
VSFILDPYRFAVPVPGLAWDPLKARSPTSFLFFTDSDSRVERTVGGSDGFYTILGTTGKTSGRWAFEVIPETVDDRSYFFGVANEEVLTGAVNIYNGDLFVGQNSTASRESIGYWCDSGQTVRWSGNVATGQVAHGNPIALGDVMTIDVDFASGNIRFYRNGTLVYTRSTASVYNTFGTGTEWYPAVSIDQSSGGGRAFIRGSGLAYLPSGSTEWDDI